MLNEVDEHGAACPQSGFAGGRTGHPLAARHQGDAQGDAAGRRPAADPVRARGSLRRRHRGVHLRHRPRQERASRIISIAPTSWRRRSQQRGQDARAEADSSDAVPSSRAMRSSPASRSRWAWATPSGARATGSADEPFAVLLADELIHRRRPAASAQMVGGPRARPAATWSPSWRCRASTPSATASPR